MLENFATKTVREIAIANPATTRVFEEYKIDYCCGGNRKFKEACETAGVAAEVVQKRIVEAVNFANAAPEIPEPQTASELIDHIVNTHHVFTKEEAARLGTLMEKVCGKHGAQHAELLELESELRRLCEDLLPHMMKEEDLLFPYIKHLEMSVDKDLCVSCPPFGTVKNPVRMMIAEHDTAGDILRTMRQISKDYQVPDSACPSYQALYHGLQELEKDLHRHIHLENNLLFPQAAALEQKAIFGY